MYLIGPDKDVCYRSLSKLKSKITEIECGSIQYVELTDHWLGWVRSKAHENLHLFNNGILIGKLSFSENPENTVIKHDHDLPVEVPPLTTGLIIKREGHAILVTPLSITNVFYGGNYVSDMQLLIADAESFLPSPEGVGILSTVGYFPGNTTLFREIKKIPFLVSYNLNAHQLTNIPSFPYQKPDDIALIQRLVNIVPDHPCQYLGLSAGYDSRLVLGILRQRGVEPQLVHMSGDETELVLQIAEQLNYPCTPFVMTDTAYLSPEVYTLITDAQIYFRGGNLSCLRNSIERGALFHAGVFSASMMKNAYRGAAKTPGTQKMLYKRLIDNLFIHSHEEMVYGLRDSVSVRDLKKYLFNALSFGNDYFPFRTSKEWANWFYYLHRGMRWTPAQAADLSYFAQPIFLLADLEALSLGISSSAWSNYKNDRIRNLTAKLLPQLTVPYKDGGVHSAQPGLKNSWEKINFEYLQKVSIYLKKTKALVSQRNSANKVPAPRKDIVFSFNDVDFHAADFTKYYKSDYRDILGASRYSYWLKRAAVTVGYTLQFLGH